MREIAVQFGEMQSLTGVLTLPAGYEQHPIVVLSTVGFTTRFGPARVHTLLARQLAQLGVACLRYDLDSLGDSGSCYAHLPLKDRTQVEVGHALDFLQQQFVAQRFILAGICSGAEASLRRALVDERVVGALMVDPFSVQTPAAQRRYWWFRLKRKIMLTLGWFDYYRSNSSEDVDLVNYQYMQRDEIDAALQQLLSRDIYIHIVYTATVRESVNGTGQLQQAFPHLPIANKVHIDWLPSVTHSPIFIEQANSLAATLVKQLGARLPFL